jgi:Leucine-rich repeat (LRR) protein
MISQVPSLHEAFPLLETLDLGNNIVTEVGDGLRYMPHLSFLNIENNNLQVGACLSDTP